MANISETIAKIAFKSSKEASFSLIYESEQKKPLIIRISYKL
jgi:hypothetical protein